MANKKEIEAFLEKTGYTKKQMKQFWEECYTCNYKVKNLIDMGKNWKDLPISVIETLPTLKQKTLDARNQPQIVPISQSEAATHSETFEEMVVRKIDAGEDLTETEIRKIINRMPEISRAESENRRWSRSVESIVKMCNRTFCIEWEEGLTEFQENAYYTQPYEVTKRTYEKTIIVTKWGKNEPVKEDITTIPTKPPTEEQDLEDNFELD